MSSRIDPSVAQLGYLHYINKKLAEILRLLEMQKPEGRISTINIKVSGRKIISMIDIIGSNAMSVTIKNKGGSKLKIGINTSVTDIELEPGELIPISFSHKIISFLMLESNDTVAEVVVAW